MRILITNHALDARGGSESYLETLAFELRRLEHEVFLYAPRLGNVAANLSEHGFFVSDDPDSFPEDISVLHGQHADALAGVRDRFRKVPAIFVSHSWFIPIEDPLTDLEISAFVGLNDVTESRLRAHRATEDKPIFRLRQPITVSSADAERPSLPEAPARAFVVSRTMRDSLIDVRLACEKRGIALAEIGAPGTEVSDPRLHILGSDIVFASGRTALEAMAAAKAVFVIGESNVGGWITPETYDLLEADGFTGLQASLPCIRLDAELDKYSPRLGRDARRLIIERHAAQLHAVEMVKIYRSAGVPSGSSVPFSSLANLAIQNWSLESRAVSAELKLAKALTETRGLGYRARRLAGRIRRAIAALFRQT